MVLLATVVHCPVVGFQISAAWTAVPRSLDPVPAPPPVASTSPVGSIVRFRCRRANAIEPVQRQTGADRSRSITSAVLVVRPPPAYRILPSSYITAEPDSRLPNSRVGPFFQDPDPEVERNLV